MMPSRRQRAQPLGGVIHTYQRFDPVNLPPPTRPLPDFVSGAFEHWLTFGNMRRLTPEQLANAIHIDPSQIRGLGPSLDALIAKLEERKRRILNTYETERVLSEAASNYRDAAKHMTPPKQLARRFDEEVRAEHLRGLEQLWYRLNDEQSPFARDLVHLLEHLANKYQVDQLAAKYLFTGRTPMHIDLAIEVKQELEKLDKLLEQLRQAMKNAQVGIIDMEALAEFAEPDEMANLSALQQQIEDYVREVAKRQGIEFTPEGYQLSPKAFRIFQSRLLQQIFDDLNAARTGRHMGPVVGEGAVELPRTRPYEFGDSVAHMDLGQTLVNAFASRTFEDHCTKQTEDHCPAPQRRRVVRLDDIEIYETRNNPKCATIVILDMSGSMRHGGQYINAKRMGLALDGLIRSEYPGDYLQFIEMFTFAKPRTIGEVPSLMPKPVTVHQSVVRLMADMNDDRISELDIPPHFTNIQHALQLARQFLAPQDTPNRQVILITDGLPTAHFEGSKLFLLYPPHARTEQCTMSEAMLCMRENIVINVFLLPNWSQTPDDVQFAHRMAEHTRGRVFFTGGEDLDRYVVWDYIKQRRRIIG